MGKDRESCEKRLFDLCERILIWYKGLLIMFRIVILLCNKAVTKYSEKHIS